MARIELPDREWARLAAIADNRGVRVADLLVATIGELIDPLDQRRRIRLAVEKGLSDAVVAERVGVPKPYVAAVRRDLGLPPNRPRSLASRGRGDA